MSMASLGLNMLIPWPIIVLILRLRPVIMVQNHVLSINHWQSQYNLNILYILKYGDRQFMLPALVKTSWPRTMYYQSYSLNIHQY
jgi:hypothetical protein